MRTLTKRFGYLGGIGLAMIIIAGLYLIGSWRSYYGQPEDVGFNDLRFGVIFSIKMLLLLAMLTVTALHTFVVGPRQMVKMEAVAAGENVSAEEVRKVRMQSMMLSMSGLTLTLVIMVLGVMLTTANFSMKAF